MTESSDGGGGADPPLSPSAPASAKRRGRPPASDSAETKQLIFDAARKLFAERGYGGVTNKDVASAAGITSGALYHYVESKRDLYVAVHGDVQRRVYGRFQQAVQCSDTFQGQFEAVLDAAQQLTEEDPSMALFFGTVRTDLRRHPELHGQLSGDDALRERFFVNMVDVGLRTGEIAEEDKPMVRDFILTVLIGLTDGAFASNAGHRQAVDAIKAALRGQLVRRID